MNLRNISRLAGMRVAALSLAAAPGWAWAAEPMTVQGFITRDVPCFADEFGQQELRCAVTEFQLPQTTRSAANRRAPLKTTAGDVRWLLVSTLTTGARKELGAPAPAATEGRVQRAQGDPDALGPTATPRVMQAKSTEIPRCTEKLGTLAIVDGDDPRGWSQYGLASPTTLMRSIVQQSGCFDIVSRGSAMNAHAGERELGHGSNVGRGQLKAVDYVLVAELPTDKPGSSFAGALGGLTGGGFGAIAGGVKTKKVEAGTILSLTDTRTTQTVAMSDGHAARTDLGWGAGSGPATFGGAVGGGYEDTEIGRVVTLSFIDSYAKLVASLGLTPGSPSAAAPATTFVATRPTLIRAAPEPKGEVLRSLKPGATVFPTGRRQDGFWEVADETEMVGWVRSDDLTPAI
jgi:hypothetical protein